MRYLALSLLLLLAPLRSAEAERPWQQTLLFDWLYPGEAPYEALKSAALATNSNDWIAARIQRGERIPQASARELAFKLSQAPGLSPDLKAKLATLLADEPELLRDKGDGSATARAAAVNTDFDRMSKRMDDIEAIFDMNRYGKGSFPAVNLDIDSGYRLDNPSSFLKGKTRGYFSGGIMVTLRGTLDKANYTFGMGVRYFPHDDDAAPYSDRESGYNFGFGFLLPLPEGGIEVHLGDSVDSKLSPLLFSTIDVANKDAFFVDVTTAFRPHADVKELELNYPYGPRTTAGLALKKQGAVWYWPFSSTQFIYAPDNQYWHEWNTKLNTWALRVDEELGSQGRYIAKTNVYGVALGVVNDEDEIRPAYTTVPLPEQHISGYSAGGELVLDGGTSLKGEFALSHYDRAGSVFEESYTDAAWIANLTLPLGPIYAGLEAGQAGPKFITRDRPPLPGVPGALDRLQSGATYDSSSFNPFPGAPAGAANYSWLSFMKNPTVLSNNSNRYALKAEWHSSWVSLGLYDGIVGQIEATGPFVTTSPYIEGSSQNGYGWFRMFGQNYSIPVAPFATPPVPSDGGKYYLWLYNKGTDGNAIYDAAGHTQAVHWQELAQYSYREGQFTVLLNKKGAGDAHIMDDSVKTINYAGGTLRFDFKSLFNRVLPLHLIVVGENRDLATDPGVPTFDGGSLFNQSYTVGFLTWGLSDSINLLGTAGYETWKTKQSFYPVNIQTHEYGIGADFKLDPLLTGLEMNLRGTMMQHEDLNLAEREFSLFTLSIGSTLTY